jgi:hypothetical protein
VKRPTRERISSISGFLAATGMTEHEAHLLEALGVVKPYRLTPGHGHRRYTDEDIQAALAYQAEQRATQAKQPPRATVDASERRPIRRGVR